MKKPMMTEERFISWKGTICRCTCHKQPKDHRGYGCCEHINEPYPTPPETGREWEDKIDWKKQVAGSMNTVYLNNRDIDVLNYSTKSLIDFLDRRFLSEHHRWKDEMKKRVEGMKVFTIHRGTLNGRVDEQWIKKSDVLALLEGGV